MRRTVYKFQADTNGLILVPHSFVKPLHFAMQNVLAMEVPTLWAEVSPEMVGPPAEYVIHGTGHNVPDGERWVGTCQDGPYVWHLYERKGPIGGEPAVAGDYR